MLCYVWVVVWTLGCSALDEPGETCHGDTCAAKADAEFHREFCARPRPIYRAQFPQAMTAQQCADICRQTISCLYFKADGHICDMFSSCKSEWSDAANLATELSQIPEDPARCTWTSRRQQDQARRAVRAAATQGGELQQHLVDAALHHVNSPAFESCPLAGAAIRILHVWAAASYHHGWRPSLAFATEARELPFTTELTLLLDVPWPELLSSLWSKALFLALAQVAEGLCRRLANSSVEANCTAAPGQCDVGRAASLLQKSAPSAAEKALLKAQRLLSPCASDGRLSSLLRVKDVSRLFAELANLAPPLDGEVGQQLENACAGAVAPVELDSLATRVVVRDDRLAAIGLAASKRTCGDLMGSGKKTRLLDILVFMEPLQSTGHLSGFFNAYTENRCEMDFFSHFHSVFCMLGDGPDHDATWVRLAFMTSGLLVHPPYGPGAWSCILPAKRSRIDLSLVDPFRWQRPLRLRMRVRAAPQKYQFAVCPQPLYRLESNRDLLEDWLDYHNDMGIDHWSVYDLDGSGAAALSRRKDVDYHPDFPSTLNSTRLAEGNWWNPICLEAIALTQCFWRYRGRAETVFSLHSFDEFLVSAKHRQGGFKRWLSAAAMDNLTTVVRLPAVNYGGAAAAGKSPLIQRFRRHTGKLYWHIVGANPDHVLSVNTTNAWPEPPRKQNAFFQPDVFRVNHYVDALGARDQRQDQFIHEDPEKVLGWAAERLQEARKRRQARREGGLSTAGPLLAAALRAAEVNSFANKEDQADNISGMLYSAFGIMSPAVRVAFRVAGLEEEGRVRKVLRDGFASCDTGQDGTLSAAEFRACAEPQGWDAHLQRRDFHYAGIFLHAWASKATAQTLYDDMDVDPHDGHLSRAEWEEGFALVAVVWGVKMPNFEVLLSPRRDDGKVSRHQVASGSVLDKK
ncbi:unnamed protein product [Symbiodinium natans]|uniref:EF-hand domain-containing protein n=1 Tax=Symbiodinium natans TaxID=878477 RepID=A0A812S6Z6_9DINO|nr:unnamed protein product [Symbiodinium natans]